MLTFVATSISQIQQRLCRNVAFCVEMGMSHDCNLRSALAHLRGTNDMSLLPSSHMARRSKGTIVSNELVSNDQITWIDTPTLGA